MKPRYALEIFEGSLRSYEYSAGISSQTDNARGHYWRLRSRHNGKIVAVGAEPFASRSNALRSFRQLGLPESAWEVR